MELKRLAQIKKMVEIEKDSAQKMLEGDIDGYDGADGARTVNHLCDIINELIVDIET